MYHARQKTSTSSQYAEEIMDAPTMNWYIQNLGVYFPNIKRVFID